MSQRKMRENNRMSETVCKVEVGTVHLRTIQKRHPHEHKWKGKSCSWKKKKSFSKYVSTKMEQSKCGGLW